MSVREEPIWEETERLSSRGISRNVSHSVEFRRICLVIVALRGGWSLGASVVRVFLFVKLRDVGSRRRVCGRLGVRCVNLLKMTFGKGWKQGTS